MINIVKNLQKILQKYLIFVVYYVKIPVLLSK